MASLPGYPVLVSCSLGWGSNNQIYLLLENGLNCRKILLLLYIVLDFVEYHVLNPK